jgi:hypothetical protein
MLEVMGGMAELRTAVVLLETLEVCIPLDQEDLLLRLELFQELENTDMYSARIWRLESYRLQSSFPQRGGTPAHQPSDEIILKEFEGFEALAEPVRFPSRGEARTELLRQLSDWAKQLRGPHGQ